MIQPCDKVLRGVCLMCFLPRAAMLKFPQRLKEVVTSGKGVIKPNKDYEQEINEEVCSILFISTAGGVLFFAPRQLKVVIFGWHDNAPGG